VRPPVVQPVPAHMADKKPTTATPDESERRKAQFTRIGAWTDPEPQRQPAPEERTDEAEAS